MKYFQSTKTKECYDIKTFDSIFEIRDFLNANKIPKENVIGIIPELYSYRLLYVLEHKENKQYG